MSETIAEFLLARIAEDEALARAAADSVNEHASRYAAGEYAYDEPLGGSWAATDYGMVRGENLDLWDCEGSDTLCTTPAAATHMARHDPVRILAECAAKRAILAAHRPSMDPHGDPDGATCTMCADSGPDAQGFPCATIRALAAVYSDHPDYQSAWSMS